MASFVSSSSDEEQVIDLARFLNKLQTKGKEPNEEFVQMCTKLQTDSKYVEVLDKLVNEHALVFAEGAEKDIEAYLLIIISLARRLPSAPSLAAINKIQAALVSSTDDKAALRLKLLNDLYNIVDDNPALRYNLFISIAKYAIASHNADLVIKELSSEQKLNARIKQWGIAPEATREIYKLVRDSFKEAGRNIEAYNWSVKYLATYDKPDASLLPEAASVALTAIALPNLFQFDTLLDLPLVKQMESSKEHAKLYQLVKIFVEDNFESFKAFIGANADYLKSVGLKEEDAMHKMRLLSLATLGAANQEVPYSLIAKTLHIDENEVENWVITAMSEDVIEARMDQMRRIVTISRSLQRVFTKAQWKQLSDNLVSWRNNTKNILKTMQDNRQVAFGKTQKA